MEEKEQLYKTLDEFVNPAERPAESGVLGSYAGVVSVPNRPNYVYVRLSSGIVVEAYNNLVPPLLNLNVLVGTNPQRPSELKVLDVLLGMHPDGIGVPLTPKHGTSHEWPANDTVYIRYRQILPLRTNVVSGMEVSVFPGWYINPLRQVKYFPGTSTNINMATYRPSTGARWALLSLDVSGSINVTTFDTGTSYFDLTINDIPPCPENEIALSAIRCRVSQTTIADNALSTSELVDLRYVPQANQNTSATTATWGGIVGTLSNQTDLQSALDGKTEEAPDTTGTVYGRTDSTWVEVPPEAPNDDNQYVRKNKSWQEIVVDVEEAPIDDNQYVRKNAGWQEIVVDVEEAPIDGKQYARKDAGWEEVAATEAQIVDDLSSQIDGSGSVYSLLDTYSVFSVYWNGQRLYETQYTDATGTLVLDFVPDVTDTLVSFGTSTLASLSIGDGDMLKSTYDTNDDGVVDSADEIDGVDTAGNSKYYGTDASGTPGFHTLSSGSGGGSELLGYAESSTLYTTTSTSLTDVDSTNLKVSFTVPSSGKVVVILSGLPDADSGATAGDRQSWGLISGSTEVANSLRMATRYSVARTGSFVTIRIPISGLTPNDAIEWKWAWKVNNSRSTARIVTIDSESPLSTMEVWSA